MLSSIMSHLSIDIASVRDNTHDIYDTK